MSDHDRLHPGRADTRERALGGRFPLLGPEQLDAAQQTLYDAITDSPRTDGPFLVVDDEGHLAGPFNAMLHSPAVGTALQALGSALRFGGSLPARTRELVICSLAATLRSDYEWYAHSRVARQVGVTTDELDALARGEVPPSLSAGERVALTLATAVLGGEPIAEDLHALALQTLEHTGIIELTVLVGYYRTLAGLLAVGDVPAPTGGAPFAPGRPTAP